jgi:hypothetical protein
MAQLPSTRQVACRSSSIQQGRLFLHCLLFRWVCYVPGEFFRLLCFLTVVEKLHILNSSFGTEEVLASGKLKEAGSSVAAFLEKALEGSVGATRGSMRTTHPTTRSMTLPELGGPFLSQNRMLRRHSRNRHSPLSSKHESLILLFCYFNYLILPCFLIGFFFFLVLDFKLFIVWVFFYLLLYALFGFSFLFCIFFNFPCSFYSFLSPLLEGG